MVELTRRTPKAKSPIAAAIAPLPSFDDLDDDDDAPPTAASSDTATGSADTTTGSGDTVTESVAGETTAVPSSPAAIVKASVTQSPPSAAVEATATLPPPVEHFRATLSRETARLTGLCSEWDDVIQQHAKSMSEEGMLCIVSLAFTRRNLPHCFSQSFQCVLDHST